MYNIGAPFLIQLNNASGTNIGHVTNFSNLRIVEKLNEIGSMFVDIALADLPMLPTTTSANIEAIYSLTLIATGFENNLSGSSYEFIVNNHYYSTDKLIITFECDALPVELTWKVVGSSLLSNATPTATINNLLGIQPNPWTGTTTGSLPNNNTIKTIWELENVWAAVNIMRKWSGGWFRWEGGRTLIHGQFNADISSITPDHYIGVDNASPHFIVKSVIEKTNKSQIVNLVIPLGGGVYPLKNNLNITIGETPLNLYYSDKSSPYTRTYDSTRRNWYIQDTTSQTAYGIRAAKLSYVDIKPVSSSKADLTAASNALYDVATYYLNKYKNPQYVYELQVTGRFVQRLKIGQCIQLNWSGLVTAFDGKLMHRTIDRKLYIIGIDWDYSANTVQPIARLTVSTNGDDIQDFIDVTSDIVTDVNKLVTKPQASLACKTWDSGMEYMATYSYVPGTTNYRLDLPFNFGAEVVTLNEFKAYLYLKNYIIPSDRVVQSTGIVDPTYSSQYDLSTNNINQASPTFDLINATGAAVSLSYTLGSPIYFGSYVSIYPINITADNVMNSASDWNTKWFVLRFNLYWNGTVVRLRAGMNIQARVTLLPYLT